MSARYVSDEFVGRDRELSHLAVALEAALDGASPRLLIAGRGGIGVSRLVSETIRRIRRLADPVRVVRCTARPARSMDAFAPIAEGFTPWLSSLDDDELARIVGPGAEPLGRLLPELAPRLGVAASRGRRGAIAPERRAAWLSEAIQGLLERAGERDPILLVLEDLHHADAGTRNLAAFLARVTRPSRVCLVMTYGSDRIARGHPLLPQLAAMSASSEPPQTVEVGPLDRFDVARLVAALDGERPTAAALLLVAERSGGIPLIAEEVLAARRELPGVSLGSTLDELVLARIARRGPECRRVLRLLAPAGLPIERRALARVAGSFEALSEGLPPRSTTRPRRGDGTLDADLRAGLAEAIEHGFVVEDDTARLSIRHELVARAIEEDLLPIQRRRHHLALAAALGSSPAAALSHWLAAHESGRARTAALAAAAAAEALDSAGDALAARELALELGPIGKAARSAEGTLLIETAEIALAAGRPDRALAYLETAAGRYGEREDAEVKAALHETLGRTARTLGDHDRALAEHRRAVSIVPRRSSLLRARVLASLAQTLMLLGRFGEAARVGGEAIGAARSVGPDGGSVEAHAMVTVGVAEAWGASGTAGIARLESARDLARELDDPDVGFRATLNLTTSLALVGRRDDAIAITKEAVEEARRDGLEVAYGNPLRGNIAEALFTAGRWAEARDTIQRALEWSPDAVAFADASLTAAMLEVETSVDERAASLLGWRPIEIDHAPDPQLEVPATRAAASFALWRGDVADARRSVERGWALVRGSEDWAITARMAATYLEVQAAAAEDARERRALPEVTGARQRARAVLAEAEAALRSSGLPAGAPSRLEADANLATARAYGARLEGSDDAALWDAASEAWQRAGQPYQVARSRWRHAEAALPARDARVGRAAARAPLLEAVRIARELGARPLLRELTALANRALINLPPDPNAPPPVPVGPGVPGAAGGPPASEPSEDRSPSARRGRVAVPVVAEEPDRQGEPLALRSSAGAGAVPIARPAIAAAFASDEGTGRANETFGLSRREREVLALIVEGRTNREIGERLFISQKTVGVHVGNILAKLGASGRVEAAMVAVRLELVPNPTGPSDRVIAPASG